MMIVTDATQEELEAADKAVTDFMGQWIETGQNPSALIVAMAEFVQAVINEIGEPQEVH